MSELIDDLVAKHTRLKELQESSSEIAEAVKLAQEEQATLDELKQRLMPVIAPAPVPYPVMVMVYPDWTYRPPRYDWWNQPPFVVTSGTTTAPCGTVVTRGMN